MRVGITAQIKEINKGVANVSCKIQQEFVVPMFMPIAFEAILKAMKDTNKRAFYEAMSNFADEDLNDAIEFFNGRR